MYQSRDSDPCVPPLPADGTIEAYSDDLKLEEKQGNLVVNTDSIPSSLSPLDLSRLSSQDQLTVRSVTVTLRREVGKEDTHKSIRALQEKYRRSSVLSRPRTEKVLPKKR